MNSQRGMLHNIYSSTHIFRP